MIKAVGRKTLAWTVIVVTFLVITLSIAGMAGLGATKAADLTPGPNIGQTVHAVYAWNGTTWVTLTITSIGSTSINVTTPQGFAVQKFVVIQDNPAYNMHGLLNTSNFYNKANIGLAAANQNSNASRVHTSNTIALTSAYFITGNIVNGTAVHNSNSKGFTNIVGNHTIFSSRVNQLNSSYEMNLFTMVEGLNEQSGFVVNVHDNSTLANNTVTMKFTQQFQHPFDLNVLTIIEGITGAMLMIDVFALFASESYHYARRVRG